ncbi:MAG: DegV family protein [Anaerolineales bacterium]|jgi:DegV family protein with EDD domain
MTRTVLVTDSTAYIPDDLVKQYGIMVAPQILLWGEETFLDGVTITPAEFYARLQSTDIMPTSSQATIPYFVELFKPLVEEGANILAILISEKLSGTIQSATQAKKEYPGATIEIVDSESTAMELGFQVLAAARAVEAGKSFEEVLALAQNAKKHTGVYFAVDTLEFLHRGGRIGGASKLLGTALNIKPLLAVLDGRVESIEKVRTKSKAYDRLLDVIGEQIDGKPNVRLATLHAAAEEDARELLKKAQARFNPIESIIAEVSPVVGTHAGPGTCGLAYSVDL